MAGVGGGSWSGWCQWSSLGASDIHSGAERPQGHPHPKADHFSGSGFSAPPPPSRVVSQGRGEGAVLKSVVSWRSFVVSRRLLEDGHPRSGREFRDRSGSCVIAGGVAVGLRVEGAWGRPLLGLGLTGVIQVLSCPSGCSPAPARLPTSLSVRSCVGRVLGRPWCLRRCLRFGASLLLAASSPALFLLQSPHPHPQQRL